MVKELFEYAIYAKQKDFPKLILMTNGLLINKNNINQLKVFDSIQLSIDVPPGDESCFRENYLSDLISKIELLKNNNIKVTLQAALHKSLINSLDELDKFASEMNVEIGINRLVPVNNSFENETLNPKELQKALKKISKIKKNNKLIKCSNVLLFLVDDDRFKLLESNKRKGITGGCIAGVASIYICSNGDVLPCPFIKYVLANVFNESLNDIWFNNKVLKRLRNRTSFNGPCGSCNSKYFCGGCRASSFYKTGSLFNSDPNCFYNEKLG